MLRDGFVYRDWQNELMIIGTRLHLVGEPLLFGKEATVDVGLLNIVHRQRNLLILVVLVEIMIGQIRFLLRSNHPFHQFHCRIILAAITIALGSHHHFFQRARVGLELHGHRKGRIRLHGELFALITHRTNGEYPPLMMLNRETSLCIAAHGHVVPFIGSAGISNRIARQYIGHYACDLGLSCCRKP